MGMSLTLGVGPRSKTYDTLDIQQAMNRRYSGLLNQYKTTKARHMKEDRAFMEGERWPSHYGDCEWDNEDKICMHDSVSYKSENMHKLGAQMAQTIDELFLDANRDELAEVTGWQPDAVFYTKRSGKTMKFRRYGSGDNAGWQITLWRRFTMWLSIWSTKQSKVISEMASKLAIVESEVTRLRKHIGGNSDYFSWYGDSSVPLYQKHMELRRDLDLMLKRHKLCIKHNKESVTLESCANKSGGKRGKA